MAINSFETVFESRERKFQTEKIFQGEDVDLVARITNDGVPQDLTGYSVTGYYQPTDYPGTDQASLFYSLTAEISQDKKEVIVHWTYDKDFGKQGYMVWALLSKGTEHVYPVAWKINLAHSPGYPAGETPEPIPQVLDFSQYTLLNDIWLRLTGGTVTGNVAVTGKFKSQDVVVNDASSTQVWIGSNAGTETGATPAAVAIGYSAKSNAFGTAIGTGSTTGITGEVALGFQAKATGMKTTALGDGAQATGPVALAIGSGPTATQTGSIAVGYGAHSTANNAIQIGSYAYSDESSVGTTPCTNSTANSVQIFNKQVFQTTGTPSYNPSTNNVVLVRERAPWAVSFDDVATVATTGSYNDLTNKPDLTVYATKTDLNSYLPNTGKGPAATGSGAIAIGTDSGTAYQIKATAPAAVAIGQVAQSTGNMSIAYGPYAYAWNGQGNIAIGSNSRAITEEGNSQQYGAVAIGPNAEARATAATALGSGAKALNISAVAIGRQALAKADSAIQIGWGTNETTGTTQIKSWQLLDSHGVIPEARIPWAVVKDEFISFLATDWSGNPDMSKINLMDIAVAVNKCIAAITGKTIPTGTLPSDSTVSHFILADGTDVTSNLTQFDEWTVNDVVMNSPGDRANGDAKVQSIVLGSGVTTLGHHAFAGFANLLSIDMSRATGITDIPARCFYQSPKLNTVVLPPNVQTISDASFSLCPQFRTMTIPASVTSIADYAFNQDTPRLTFTGRTIEQIQAMTNYSWRLGSGATLVGTDGTITI